MTFIMVAREAIKLYGPLVHLILELLRNRRKMMDGYWKGMSTVCCFCYFISELGPLLADKHSCGVASFNWEMPSTKSPEGIPSVQVCWWDITIDLAFISWTVHFKEKQEILWIQTRLINDMNSFCIQWGPKVRNNSNCSFLWKRRHRSIFSF